MVYLLYYVNKLQEKKKLCIYHIGRHKDQRMKPREMPYEGNTLTTIKVTRLCDQ